MTEHNTLLRELDISLEKSDKYDLPILSEQKEISKKTIAALQAGDHEAYTVVFNTYHASVKLFLSKMLRSEDKAQEITQEVFINLWQKKDKINPDKNIKGFLYTTAKFFMLDYLKHKQVEAKYEEYRISDITDFVDTPHDIVIGKELSLLLDIAISRMPRQQATVLKMRFEECKTNEQIAELLNIGVETVKTHLRRSRSELREVLSLFVTLFLVL